MPPPLLTVRDVTGDAGTLPPLIPDLSLLLSPWGVWLTRRLAQHAVVWLPRSLVMLVEDGLPLDPEATASLAPQLSLWHRCWPEIVQCERVHWFSDALDMSRAPKGDPPSLLDRFDELVTALDRKIAPECVESEATNDRLLLDGARDALALAATLPGDPAVILSAYRHAATEPWACKALDRFGLIGHRLADEALRDILAGRLLRGLATAGLAPFLGSGMARLAALHLAAPVTALPLPSARPAAGSILAGEPDEAALESLYDDMADEALWDDAVAIWYEVL
jgi:hypothetical protein